MTAEVKLLAPEEARDEVLVEELVRIINGAYAVGEAGLWVEGAARTGRDEIAEAIRTGGMLAATLEGRLVGCAYVRPLDAARRISASFRRHRTSGAAASGASWCDRRKS